MWEVWAYNDHGELGTISNVEGDRASALQTAQEYLAFYSELYICSPSGDVETVSRENVEQLIHEQAEISRKLAEKLREIGERF